VLNPSAPAFQLFTLRFDFEIGAAPPSSV
jgi:hypothetical protein